MHLPYESSGDNKKDENRTINENHMDIIIENEMTKNESETNVDDSSWPDRFHEISIDETIDVINRKCSIILAVMKSSSDQSHFIFEINVGKKRIRRRTTLNLHRQSILRRSTNSSFNL